MPNVLPPMKSTCDWLVLSPHPTSPPTGISKVAAAVCRAGDGGLVFRYRLYGQLSLLRVPSPGAGQRRDGLWQHTCCEAFIAPLAAPAYREFNFSPSGDWAAYAFFATRQRDISADPGEEARPSIEQGLGSDCLELAATLPAAALPPLGCWRIGLSVIVEDDSGVLSYWALRHPSPRPDFHHRDAFAFNFDSGPPA